MPEKQTQSGKRVNSRTGNELINLNIPGELSSLFSSRRAGSNPEKHIEIEIVAAPDAVSLAQLTSFRSKPEKNAIIRQVKRGPGRSV